MDKVLKRRLIGASILIALAVIFLPMLLVSPDEVVDDSRTDVTMPPMPDSGREVRRIPLNPETARVREAGPEREPGEDEIEPEAPARTEQPDEIVLAPEPESSEAPEIATSEPPRSVPVDPEPEPEAGDESVAASDDESARPSTDQPTDESTDQSTNRQARQAAEQPEASLGTWVVQVASFGSRESSEATRSRLESLGHIVSRDEVVRGDSVLYRLRTGPYPSRSAAEQALGQIAATVEGIEPMARQLDAEAIAGNTGFAVQVGSFASRDNAERETARLDELGFDAFQLSEDNSGRSVWRVLVGVVAEREQADALRSRLAEEAGVEGLVVSHP